MHPIRRINTIFIYVHDLTAMKRFYSETLGFGTPRIDGKFWVEFKLPDGDTHFALHRSENHNHAGQGRGAIRLSFEVVDIQRLAEHLREAGVKFHYEPRKEYGFWLAEFEDPEGNVLRLYQKLQPHERVPDAKP